MAITNSGTGPRKAPVQLWLWFILLMRFTPRSQHLAIVGDRGDLLSLIHAYAEAGACVEHSADARWLRRIVAACSFKAAAALLVASEGSAEAVPCYRDAHPLDGGRVNECRLVLDTNVFVAAGFEPNSASARLLEALRQGRCRMIWHRTTRRETERVLRRIPPLDWHRFAPLFRPEWEHRSELDLTRFGVIEDPDDRKFAALASATQSVLISNDDHLLARRDQLPVRILKPGKLLAELMRGGADDRG